MGLTTIHQPCGIEEGDSQRSDDEERQQVAVLILALEGWDQGTDHQEEPEDEPDQQEDLPHTSELYVLIALVSEPEVLDEPELLHHTHPLPY